LIFSLAQILSECNQPYSNSPSISVEFRDSPLAGLTPPHWSLASRTGSEDRVETETRERERERERERGRAPRSAIELRGVFGAGLQPISATTDDLLRISSFPFNEADSTKEAASVPQSMRTVTLEISQKLGFWKKHERRTCNDTYIQKSSNTGFETA